MNRIEKVRETADKIIPDMNDNVERRCAYLELVLIAVQRSS